METQIYRHNESNKLYALLNTNFMCKELNPDFNSELETNKETNPKYVWNRGLYLYKALYNNEDGEYFSRTKEDFEENFTQIFLRSKNHPENKFLSIDFNNNMYFTYIKDYGEIFVSEDDLYNAFDLLLEEPQYVEEGEITEEELIENNEENVLDIEYTEEESYNPTEDESRESNEE